jgi:alkyl sulfatase BDS1-like metallo-beta-lactamase superfamily hydrolase
MMVDRLVQPKNAEATTRQANQQIREELPFGDRSDFEDATRGYLGTAPDLTIYNASGDVVWSLVPYAFLAQPEAPPTVNPSLWRIAQLNLNNGLFKVTDRIYQVRAYDISNMTIVEGDTGLIVIDPLISMETARAALDLYYAHRPMRPVVAIIYTHSHVDHYGGVKGVISEEDVRTGRVHVFAPDGFLRAAVSENVFAGTAMSRRATYMYGALLQRGERGQVDAGLGKTNSLGTTTLIAPTDGDTIVDAEETRIIDGVEIAFFLAPETEAPSEMLFYFPQFRALCAAEDLTRNLHNLYTLRGAEVRNAAAWWKAIDTAITRYADRTDVLFASHHWPTWGQEKIVPFMRKQRDLYKFIHDQSLRLMNQGYTPIELAERIHLPASLADEWYNRGYYGTLNHDAKAVYQKYLGWYDANPANLHPLPPEEAGTKYVEYMGGAQAVITRAREAFERGEYRWVAQVMNHVVFAEPNNVEARHLEADALEQLGYQAESGPWRNVYLMGASELRNGVPPMGQNVSADTIKAMPLDLYFEYMGVRLNGPAAEGKEISVNWVFTDTGEQYGVALEHSVLLYWADKVLPDADATISLTRGTLDAITLQTIRYQDAVRSGLIVVEGDQEAVEELLSLLETFDMAFNIVTP